MQRMIFCVLWSVSLYSKTCSLDMLP